MSVGHLLSHLNYFSLSHKIMDENQLNRALANLTDDNEAWMAIEHLLNESSKHATLVALDVALKGEDRVWQCGYAQAIGDIHRTLDKRRNGRRSSLLIEQLRILFDHLLNQFLSLGDLGGGHYLGKLR